jgi:hypothetical protein
VAGKQREMGLVSFPSVPLAEAREKARAHRAKIESGADPISVRRAALNAAAEAPSLQQPFSTAAAQYIVSVQQTPA